MTWYFDIPIFRELSVHIVSTLNLLPYLSSFDIVPNKGDGTMQSRKARFPILSPSRPISNSFGLPPEVPLGAFCTAVDRIGKERDLASPYFRAFGRRYGILEQYDQMLRISHLVRAVLSIELLAT